MKKNYNFIIVVVLLVVVFLVGIICVSGEQENYKKTPVQKVVIPFPKKEMQPQKKPILKERVDQEIEFLGDRHGEMPHHFDEAPHHFDNYSHNNGFRDSFELIGIPSNDPALALQTGMGGGLYGSGRHTSEMVGN
jgi:hypothetical protein